MSYKIEVEHDKDGMEEYDRDRFVIDMPEILKAIKTAIKNNHHPQIGTMMHVNDESYYIVQIIYYDDSMRYCVSDEKKSVFDKGNV